jgi:hypothetical protein
MALFVAVLGGCAGPTADESLASSPEASDTPTESATQESLFAPDGSAALPEWRVGDWWEYNVVYATGETYDSRFVVHASDASNYYLTCDNRDLLLRALFTHYPTFGAVTRSTFNHFIHGVEVPFFKFPMKNQTWQAPFRAFTAEFESHYAMLPTGKGEVPGFLTTMTDTADGNPRFVSGWSPEAKYFTSFIWNFDGVGPTDVTFTLKDWGSAHKGTVPVLEITEGVHRPFPTQAVAPPNPPTPPTGNPEARATFTSPEGSDIVFGMFASAGGPGNFDFFIGNADRNAEYPWRPTAAASYFSWDLYASPPAGEWNVVGAGSAQNFAFMFLEAYAIKTDLVDV